MKRLGSTHSSLRKLLFPAAGLTAIVASAVFGFTSQAQTWTQAQPQSSAATAPDYQFDVATFKLDLRGNGRNSFTPDGYLGSGLTMHMVIEKAYNAKYFQVIGGPAWLDDDRERYEVDARMDSAAADSLQKLSPDERKLAQQRMLQTLLADRIKLAVHREKKVLPVLSLVAGKDGPKLKEATPGNAYANGLRGADGRDSGPGAWQVGGSAGVSIMTAQGITMTSLTDYLSRETNRTVQDKTGLTGKYDFTLRWVREETDSDSLEANRKGRVDTANGDLAPPPGAPSIYVAIQQQLGLKLESGKGPVEVIVIDHAERPSGN